MSKRQKLQALVDVSAPAEPSGFDALFPEAEEAHVRSILLDDLRPGASQLRDDKGYEPEALEELASSIRSVGLLQPILVRPANEGFEIIAGQRRWAAAKLTELKSVPCVVREMTDQEAAVAALIENLQREDLNPVEEAQGLKRLMQEFDYTQETAAEVVGKAKSTVSEILSILKLPEAMLEEVRTSEQINKSQLVQLAKTKDEGERAALFEAFQKGQATVRTARKRRGSETAKRPKPFVYSWAPEDKACSVRVKFKKTRATHEEIRAALEQLLESLK